MGDENGKPEWGGATAALDSPAAERSGRETSGMRDLLLKTLFEGIQEEIMVVDADFVIRDVNPGFLKRLSLPKGEVVGRKCHEVAFDWCSQHVCKTEYCHLERARDSGAPLECVHRIPDAGRSRVREIVRLVYPVGGPGEARYFVQITRDETARRQLIRRIKTSEKKFRLILDTATDAILSLDGEGRIIHFNNAARRMFGYKRKDVLGRHFSHLVPEQDGEDYRELRRFLDAVKSRRTRRPLRLKAFRQAGDSFPVEVGISCQSIEGEPVYTAILRDVSAMHQMEKKLLQNERLAAVGQAVAQVAHEIKNPLMIIGGFSQQIRKSLSDEKALQKMDLVFEEIGRLERLVAGLGDLTKHVRLIKRSCDIHAVMRDVVQVMASLHPSGKYRFEMMFEDEEAVISCDPDKLKQVFLNLLGNGIEAMEEGGSLRVSSSRSSGGILVRISDQGRGIPEEALERIFEPFFTTRQKGSGLGLAISFRLVKAHGGEIWAENNAALGTTFSIWLPED